MSSHPTIIMALVAFGLLAVGSIGVDIFGESWFVKTGFPAIAGSIGGFSTNQFYGVALSTICLPTGGAMAMTVAQRVYWIHESIVALLFLSAIAAYSSASIWTSWRADDLLACGWMFCAFSQTTKKSTDTANGYYQAIGAPSFLFCVAFAIIVFGSAVNLTRTRFRSSHTAATQQLDELRVPLNASVNTTINTPRSFNKSIFAAIFLSAFLLSNAFASTLVPNGWLNITAHKIRVNAIEKIEIKSAFKTYEFGFVTRPELPEAWFKTIGFKLPRDVIGKLFPDVVIYYSFLLFVIMISLLTRLAPKWFSVTARNRCIAAAGLLATVAYIHAWWYHNWHNWFGGISSALPFIKEPSLAEKLARMGGQILNAIMGLLCLPVTRHSPWLEVMDMSWESALWFHKSLGNAFLVACAMHVTCWYVVFSQQHVFPHDALAGTGFNKDGPHAYFPLNFHAKPGECSTLTCLDPEYNKPAADNWTIPLMSMMLFWVIIPVFGVLTLYRVRRVCFEWFYFSHRVGAMVLFAAVLWHAAAAWVFILPGLLLWIVDYVYRIVCGTRQCTVTVSREGGDNVASTMLTISIQSKDQPLRYDAGQYVFIRIPAISAVESHPFTISAAPGSRNTTIHFKPVGDDDSFTMRLSRCSKGHEMQALVQGPYGRPPRVGDYDVLVFVAGGAGITPVASLIIDAMNRFGGSSMPPTYLLWVVKDGCMYVPFEKILLERLRGMSNCRVYAVDRSQASRPELGKEIHDFVLRQGKTSSDVEIGSNSFVARKQARRTRVLVFACGPQQLIDECGVATTMEQDYVLVDDVVEFIPGRGRGLDANKDWTFHSEIFEL